MQSLQEIGNLIKKIYRERLEGDPLDLVRVYRKGNEYRVVRNDDSEARIPAADLESGLTGRVVAALKNFKLIDD